MANPARGSVPLQAGDRAYTVSFSVNAICELESAFDQPVAKIAGMLSEPENIRMSTVRSIIWAGLRDHHEDMEVREAGQIMSDAGMPACMEAIGAAFALAFPQEEASSKARPRKAAKS